MPETLENKQSPATQQNSDPSNGNPPVGMQVDDANALKRRHDDKDENPHPSKKAKADDKNAAKSKHKSTKLKEKDLELESDEEQLSESEEEAALSESEYEPSEGESENESEIKIKKEDSDDEEKSSGQKQLLSSQGNGDSYPSVSESQTAYAIQKRRNSADMIDDVPVSAAVAAFPASALASEMKVEYSAPMQEKDSLPRGDFDLPETEADFLESNKKTSEEEQLSESEEEAARSESEYEPSENESEQIKKEDSDDEEKSASSKQKPTANSNSKSIPKKIRKQVRTHLKIYFAKNHYEIDPETGKKYYYYIEYSQRPRTHRNTNGAANRSLFLIKKLVSRLGINNITIEYMEDPIGFTCDEKEYKGFGIAFYCDETAFNKLQEAVKKDADAKRFDLAGFTEEDFKRHQIFFMQTPHNKEKIKSKISKSPQNGVNHLKIFYSQLHDYTHNGKTYPCYIEYRQGTTSDKNFGNGATKNSLEAINQIIRSFPDLPFIKTRVITEPFPFECNGRYYKGYRIVFKCDKETHKRLLKKVRGDIKAKFGISIDKKLKAWPEEAFMEYQVKEGLEREKSNKPKDAKDPTKTTSKKQKLETSGSNYTARAGFWPLPSSSQDVSTPYPISSMAASSSAQSSFLAEPSAAQVTLVQQASNDPDPMSDSLGAAVSESHVLSSEKGAALSESEYEGSESESEQIKIKKEDSDDEEKSVSSKQKHTTTAAENSKNIPKRVSDHIKTHLKIYFAKNHFEVDPKTGEKYYYYIEYRQGTDDSKKINRATDNSTQRIRELAKKLDVGNLYITYLNKPIYFLCDGEKYKGFKIKFKCDETAFNKLQKAIIEDAEEKGFYLEDYSEEDFKRFQVFSDLQSSPNKKAIGQKKRKFLQSGINHLKIFYSKHHDYSCDGKTYPCYIEYRQGTDPLRTYGNGATRSSFIGIEKIIKSLQGLPAIKIQATKKTFSFKCNGEDYKGYGIIFKCDKKTHEDLLQKVREDANTKFDIEIDELLKEWSEDEFMKYQVEEGLERGKKKSNKLKDDKDPAPSSSKKQKLKTSGSNYTASAGFWAAPSSSQDASVPYPISSAAASSSAQSASSTAPNAAQATLVQASKPKKSKRKFGHDEPVDALIGTPTFTEPFFRVEKPQLK